ncbi:hypothetical protein [Labrenzia sp. PHM005]|uniref:hypothetical protein n=1 Tax=Labrenzia sp. PHM005 TaxID=2590016 RepID=UPI001AD8CE16|nr:hypothetical protein [Labrenzia sp. PHM005]
MTVLSGFFFACPKSARMKAAGAAIGGILAAGAAQAEPIALVLDKSEAVTFPAFTELSPGDVVELGNSGHIDLLDYSACREVRITSGRVMISSTGYVIDGGVEKELRAGNCLQADSGSTPSADEKKGLTVTLRSIKAANKTAASLMLRFDEQLKTDYDTVFVAFEGGAPKRFELGENILTDMPVRSEETDKVDVELFFQGKAPDFGVVMRKFTIDPASVGRKTAVVVVK